MPSSPVPDPRRTAWRVGDRTPLADGGVEVAWRLDPEGHRRRRFGRQRQPEVARVTDVSDGGAGVVVAAASHEVGVGSEVTMGLGDHRATALVTRTEDLPDGQRRYGVRFLHVGAGFRAELLRHRDNARVAPGRPSAGVWGTPH